MNTLTLGPVRCAWWPHRHGEAAEPQVRAWLAQRLGSEAAALAVWRDPHGRPQLGGAHVAFDVNWSHSGDLLLAALAEGAQIGVDIERLRPRPRALALAQRFFSAEETQWLERLPQAALETAFLQLWCAKEAVLKAHGRGLSFGLHRLRFVADEDRLRLAACDTELGAPGDWSVHGWQPANGYLATLAWRAWP